MLKELTLATFFDYHFSFHPPPIYPSPIYKKGTRGFYRQVLEPVHTLIPPSPFIDTLPTAHFSLNLLLPFSVLSRQS
jgi:hypothetical protein